MTHTKNPPILPRTEELATAILEFLLFVTLAFFYAAMTLAVNWKYSIDMQVLRDVIEIYPYREDLGSALTDNSALVWLLLQAEALSDAEDLLKILYFTTFLFKTSVLLRLAGPKATLAFTLLFFFSIDLNQARMSLAISFILLAHHSFEKRKILLFCTFLGAAVICHYPGAMTLALFFLAARFPKFTVLGSIFAATLFTIMLMSDDSPILRYLAYIEDSGEGGQASFFIVTTILTAVFWKKISPLQRGIMVASVAISLVFRDLLNLSGRISELSATVMLLWCYRRPSAARQLPSPTTVFLIVGALFFFYRFGQWVILDQVPEPSNL